MQSDVHVDAAKIKMRSLFVKVETSVEEEPYLLLRWD